MTIDWLIIPILVMLFGMLVFFVVWILPRVIYLCVSMAVHASGMAKYELERDLQKLKEKLDHGKE